MPRKRAQGPAQPDAAGSHLGRDLYTAAVADLDDVFYSGSDNEDYESPEEREQRLIAAAQRFLLNGKPYIMSSHLNGPFEASSGWTNPWSRKSHRAPAAGRKSKSGCMTPREPAVKPTQQHTTGAKKTKETHLPTPESLSSAHNVCSGPLSSNDRIKKWQRTVVPPDANDMSLGASPSISQSQPGKRKLDKEPTLWERRKRSKPLTQVPEEIRTPASRYDRPQSSQRTKGSLHSKERAERREDKDSNDELMITSPTPFRKHNSNRLRTPSVPAKRSPVKEVFSSQHNESEDELGTPTSKGQKPAAPVTPASSELSAPPTDITRRHLPQSETESLSESEECSTTEDSPSPIQTSTPMKRAQDTELRRPTTPNTPTMHHASESEDESSSDDDDMSIISDSRMRALSVELNGPKETKPPRRSTRLRAEADIPVASIIVVTQSSDESGSESTESENIDGSAETECESEAAGDIEMGTGSSPQKISESLSSEVDGCSPAVDSRDNQTTSSTRQPLGALDTNELNKPVENPKAATRSSSSTFSEARTSPVSDDSARPAIKPQQSSLRLSPNRNVPEYPSSMATVTRPQTPTATVWKTPVKTSNMRSLEIEKPAPEPYIPSFASFMSPSPKRVRPQRTWPSNRPRKTVSWAPLPDGKDAGNFGSEPSASVIGLAHGDCCEDVVRSGDTSRPSRRMASPPPDSEAVDSAIEEGQSLGLLFTRLNGKEERRPMAPLAVESCEPMQVDEIPGQAMSDDKKVSGSEGLVATAAAPSGSNEDAWLDTIMDNVENELATHAWDEPVTSQANEGLAFGF